MVSKIDWQINVSELDFQCGNSQKPLTGSEGDACPEKKPSQRKGEIRPHFSRIPRLNGRFSTRQLARLFAKSWSFACGFCLLLAIRDSKTSIIKKATKWTYHPLLKNTEFGRINLKTTSAFQRLVWEKRRFSNSPWRHSLLQRSRVKTKTKQSWNSKIIKLKLKKGISQLRLFLPLQPSLTRRRQRIKMESEENQRNPIKILTLKTK